MYSPAHVFVRALAHRFSRPFPFITLLVAAFPLMLVCALFGFVFKAAGHVGHFPSYGNPDPKQLPWDVELAALRAGWMGVPLVSLAAICLAIQGRLHSREFPLRPVIVIAVLSFVAFALYSRLDPGGMVAWLWD